MLQFICQWPECEHLLVCMWNDKCVSNVVPQMDYFTTNLIGTTTTTCLYILAFSVCNAVTMELDWIAALALMHIPSLVKYTNCSPEALATILLICGGFRSQMVTVRRVPRVHALLRSRRYLSINSLLKLYLYLQGVPWQPSLRSIHTLLPTQL